MTKYAYPATLETDERGHVSVHFDDLPGSTWGETLDEAMAHASALLTTSIEMLLEDGVTLPPPLPANGRPVVIADLD